MLRLSKLVLPSSAITRVDVRPEGYLLACAYGQVLVNRNSHDYQVVTRWLVKLM